MFPVGGYSEVRIGQEILKGCSAVHDVISVTGMVTRTKLTYKFDLECRDMSAPFDISSFTTSKELDAMDPFAAHCSVSS